MTTSPARRPTKRRTPRRRAPRTPTLPVTIPPPGRTGGGGRRSPASSSWNWRRSSTARSTCPSPSAPRSHMPSNSARCK
ncbi:unnamed protein product [Staurois parvus]|uniref:Uncharacterized protein n=1 Tax=Staurois parvus TaxID=386267 RepID=A0ABN9G2F1_9NEOB|nr:unnamed protein product [Staurois parvus]